MFIKDLAQQQHNAIWWRGEAVAAEGGRLGNKGVRGSLEFIPSTGFPPRLNLNSQLICLTCFNIYLLPLLPGLKERERERKKGSYCVLTEVIKFTDHRGLVCHGGSKHLSSSVGSWRVVSISGLVSLFPS